VKKQSEIEINMRIFRPAPMSKGIAALTVFMLSIPVTMLIVAVSATSWDLGGLSMFFALIYAWIWFRFRPTAFVITPNTLEIIWPMKRRSISRSGIQAVRLVDSAMLKREIGRGARVGAGGLWGGFGWLWTSRRGIVQMYISRTDYLVWIERGNERPWLISPERPVEFVHQLSPAKPADAPPA
jgi:hypothetical protein